MNNTEQLVDMVINGDMRAFESLYQESSKQVYYTCLNFLKNEQDALDIMQDAYISALTHLKELQNKNRFSQWVNQIAVNKCKNFIAKKRPIPMDDEILGQIPMDNNELVLPEKYITDQASRKILLDIMSENLSAVQYQTVILYYFDGLSQAEIAQCMNCPEGTVSYRLSVAKSKIKNAVEKYETSSGDKLYSVAGLPFLTALFLAETNTLAVPNILATITGSVLTAGSVSSAAGSMVATYTGSASTVASGTMASAATKTGIKAFLATVKGKIIAGVTGLALLGGVAAGAVLLSKDKETKPVEVYDSQYLNIEYVDATYDQADRQYSNGQIVVDLNVENKTDEIILITEYMYCANHMTDFEFPGNGEGVLHPGENKIKLYVDLFSMRDEGTVNISEADILICPIYNGSNTADLLEKAYFHIDFGKTFTIDARPYYPYADCEVVFSDDYIEFASCGYYSESDMTTEYGYIYNNSDIILNVDYTDQLHRYSTDFIFPDSYTKYLNSFSLEQPDKVRLEGVFTVRDYMVNLISTGDIIYSTDYFYYDVIKAE